ncbi:ketopantoate reductase [Lentzea xinjiangensis]|uniref:Ketopantoate reductase n=1 Tax=Lentzea xinjiangensis TaxID=402600 RepID=A0A1H9RJ90_9PSEU|nr:2-dehydropantoate 2-reductase N-terminal domain-containing protein [Lentzea xinjiangensis]SER72009.1 ketopantoate reductase [Lentzea xinjiangensis]
MKVLMFGRGTIASLYGWALARAGHRVEFYVRPGRAAQYAPEVDLRIRDGRTRRGPAVRERWPITLREDLDAGHDYDLIVLSVNHDQLDGAVEFLSSRVGDATVLMFGNVWEDPAAVVSALPADQVVWGFPGGGGGYAGSTLSGGIVKTVFLGFCDGSNRGARYQAVRGLFRSTGFSVSEVPDFRSWLWFHFILDAGILSQALAVGGHAGLVRSRAAIEEVVMLVREMIPLLEAKGGTPRLGAALVSRVPARLLSFVLQKVLTGDNMLTFLMEQLDSAGQMTPGAGGVYARDVLAEARRRGVALPRLEALEPLFSAGRR